MPEFRSGVAVITGAASGIGRAIAVELASESLGGLVLLDRDASGLEGTKAIIATLSPSLHVAAHTLDIARRSDIARVRDDVEKEFGRVSFLFNVAGIIGLSDTPFFGDELSEVRFDNCLAVNLHGTIDCTRAFLPLVVKEPWGCVVNVSSAAGLVATPWMMDYATSKFAVRGFSESLMMQMRESHPHVTVHLVHPGVVGTNLLANQVKAGVKSGEWLEKFGLPASATESDVLKFAESFNERASVTAKDAAQLILTRIKRGNWRILVGRDARLADTIYRISPSLIYNLVGLGRVEPLLTPSEREQLQRKTMIAMLGAIAVGTVAMRSLRSRL